MQNLFIILSFLMGVVVLASNYLVQFPFNFFSLAEILTYGAFSYPIAFLITDLANRFYGKIFARKIMSEYDIPQPFPFLEIHLILISQNFPPLK